ncbi:MAG: hypothetical protein LBN03_00935 [Bifidobacteriaceae bacterium]|jgi:hypothetical protein|nr:hypothetical protein [Bifidobacteriaceae bacterium]
MTNSNKLFLASKLVIILNYRDLKKFIKSNLFYLSIAAIIGLMFLSLSSLVITKTLSPILQFSFSSDINENKYVLLKSFGVSISILSSISFLVKKLICGNFSKHTKMLKMYGVSNLKISIISRCGTIVIIDLILSILILILFFPSIYTLDVDFKFKLLFVFSLLLQSIFFLIFLDLVDRIIIGFLIKIQAPFITVFSKIFFIVIFASMFYCIFKYKIIENHIFNPSFLISSIIFPSVDNVSKMYAGEIISFLFLAIIILLSILLNFIDLSFEECFTLPVILKKLPFINGDFCMLTKTIKETFRNAEFISNYIITTLLILILYIFKPSLYTNGIFIYMILFPVSTFLYSFSYENSVHFLYITRKINTIKIFITSTLSSFLISTISIVILLQLFVYSNFNINYYELIIDGFLCGSIFILLGVVFPINKYNAKSSTIMVILLILLIIPIGIVYSQLLTYFELSSNVIFLIKLICSIILLLSGFLSFKQKYIIKE